MTPFGRRIRELRADRGVSQKQMAEALGVSAAYLSALENGYRGVPTWSFIQKVIGYFNVIWDDADELLHLALISHPKITIDTSTLDPLATEFTNLLSRNIDKLSQDDLEFMIHELKVRCNRNQRPSG